MYNDSETGTFDLSKYLWKNGWKYVIGIAIGLMLYYTATGISQNLRNNKFRDLEQNIIDHTANYMSENGIRLAEGEKRFISFAEMNYTTPKNLKCKKEGGILFADTEGFSSAEFYYQCKEKESDAISKITNINNQIARYIELKGDNPTYVETLNDYEEAGFKAGEVEENIIVSNNFKNAKGVYQVQYIATGQNGDYVPTRIVIVGETSELAESNKPKLILKGEKSATIILGDTYNDPGYTANDLLDGNITNKLKVSGTVNTNVAGDYLITYTVTNSSGKTASETRTVNVIGIDFPTITLLGSKEMNTYVGDTFIDPGFIANDITDGNITNSVIVDNTINTKVASTYKVTYKVTNSSGKTTSETRTVKVENKLSTVALSLTQSITAYTNKAVTITAKITGDNYSHTLLPDGTTSYDQTISYQVKTNGTYIFKAYDKNGNVVTQNITISNIDTIPPTGSCVGKNNTITVYANDNVGISGYKYSSSSQTSGKILTTSYTFSNNISSASVIIYDTVENSTTITCTIEKKPTTVDIAEITLSTTTPSINVGGSYHLTINISPSNATNQSITWTSSNTSVATVTDGYIYGVKAGTSVITAQSNNGKTATATITVKTVATPPAVDVTGITVAPTTPSIYVGDSIRIAATISPSNATNQSITWTSSNTSVATVNSGSVYGVKAGTSVITARSNNGKTATTTITVKEVPSTPSANTGTLEMHVINNSKWSTSDAIIIRTDTKVIMIDAAGRDGDEANTINYLKKLGINKIDVLIGTHFHGDHMGNFPAILKSFKVDNLYLMYNIDTCAKDKICPSSASYPAKIRSILNAQPANDKTELRIMKNGDMFFVGEVSLLCIGPTKITPFKSADASDANSIMNKNSLNIIATFGSTKIYLAGDGIQQNSVLESYQNEISNIDILKYPHHGLFAMSDKFVKVIKPKYTLVSTNDNKFDNKNTYADSKKYLTKYGSTIYQTYSHGNLLAISNGTTYKVYTKIKPEDYKR